MSGWTTFIDPVYCYYLRYPANWNHFSSNNQMWQYFTTSATDNAATVGPKGWWLTLSRIPYIQPSCIYVVPNPTTTTQLTVAGTIARMYYREGPIPNGNDSDVIDLGVAAAKTCYSFALSYQGRMGTADFATAEAIFASFTLGSND